MPTDTDPTAEQMNQQQRIQALIERLRTRGDNAYLNYIEWSRKPECLGWEAKVERNTFGWPEMEAHTKRGELLGRHRAMYEAAKQIEEDLQELLK